MEIQSTKKRYGNVLLLSVDGFLGLSIEELFITPILHSYGKSYLYAHYDYDENNKFYLYILTLHTKPKYRGLKYASTLLRRCIYEAKKNKCKYIKLMDHSDLFNHEANIYLKHGFKYENIGQPEMIYMIDI
jgi:ribosomal protein S18 acetylase RimI-like enzyme